MSEATKTTELYGLLAEFETPEELVEKTEQAYRAGYREMDAYTPFPVHGLSEALGIKRNLVPYIVLLGAILGGLAGYGLQYYTAVLSYPINVGGRPLHSWPAFMVVTFEGAVLIAAGLGVVGMLALNNLPLPYHPLFNAPRFNMATGDRFFLCIMGHDPQFDPVETRAFMESLEPTHITEVEQDESTPIYE